MSHSLVPIRKALISVSDKSGLEDLCKELHSWGTEIYATLGTGRALESWGIPFTAVEAFTQSPEILGGRVKTLHPRIFGSILARREQDSDLADIHQQGLCLFDLVVVNLYPFEEHLTKTVKEQTDFIDIGGSALMRAAAKNHLWVTVLSDPADYGEFLEQARTSQTSAYSLRFSMAQRTFLRASRYDRLIYESWSQSPFPTQVELTPQRPLRYGENPHQRAAFCGCPPWKLLGGKELSYNNLLDSEAATSLVSEFEEPVVAIIKHNNPCGVAWGNKSLRGLFLDAYEADSKSAFGGIVAMNRPLDQELAQTLSEFFLEVIIAPEFPAESLEILQAKKNLRLIEWGSPQGSDFEVRFGMGGWLVQERDQKPEQVSLKPVVAGLKLEAETLQDILGAWKVCKHARSNAIVIAKNSCTLGIGAGQVSRIDSLELALLKAGENVSGSFLVSDAFFPFRDSIDRLKGLGIRAIVQPGGSKRDEEVILACQEHGIPLFFTGTRHFKH